MRATVREMFSQENQRAVREHVDELKGLQAVYKLVITGEEGGVWIIDLKSDPVRYYEVRDEGEADAVVADCTLTMDNDDFLKLCNNYALVLRLYNSGRLKVDNIVLGMKMRRLIPLLKKHGHVPKANRSGRRGGGPP